jgi:head-tail adaptor
MSRIDGSKPLNPGKLRDLIVITRKVVSSQNEYGEDVYTEEEVMRFFAHVRAMSGAELQRLEQRWAEARFVIETWFLTVQIDREWIATWGTRRLNILDAEDPEGMRRRTRMYAREVL